MKLLLTNVAMRCGKCGVLKTVTIRGNHTLESLRGESSKISSILKETERISR